MINADAGVTAACRQQGHAMGAATVPRQSRATFQRHYRRKWP